MAFLIFFFLLKLGCCLFFATTNFIIMKHRFTKLLTVLFLAASAGNMSAAPVTVREPAVVKNPLDVRILAKSDKLTKHEPRKQKKNLKKRFSADAENITFTGAFQSFHEDYEFNYDGGEFLSYDVKVTLDGESATISNLFNFVAGDPYGSTEEYDIQGKYDAASNTITVATPHEFDQATEIGKVYGYYPLTLICGTVDANGGITPEPELVITLSPDHSRATFSNNFGARMYTAEGASQGFKCVYKGGLMKTDISNPETVCFSTSLDFGKCWVNEAKEKELKVFNLGDDYAEVPLSVQGDAFFTSSATAVLPAMEASPIVISALPKAEGAVNGTLTIGGSKTVALSCDADVMPDYSFIVKDGDFKFTTGSEYPFVKDTFNGVDVARSDNEAAVCDSYLKVTFSVPEGKIGVFSWKGWSSSEISFNSNPSIIADDKEIFNYAGLLDKTIDDSYSFGPGEHTVVFNYSVYTVSYFTENDRMRLYDLNLDLRDIKAHDAKLLTDGIKFPNSVLFDATTQKYSNISIRNEGSSPLEVTEMTLPECISAEKPSRAAATLETVEIPVTFNASEAGNYEGDIVVNTDAGEFKVPFTALVRDMPDFNSIVKAGDFTFTTDEENPFLVKDGVAFNSTARVKDEEVTLSSMTASFNVPEGKVGILSWKGRVSCMPYDESGWTDYLSLTVSHSSGTMIHILPGEIDLSSDKYPYFENPDMADLVCPPGYGYVTFAYIQYGDGVYGGDDIVEVNDLSLELFDSEANSAVLMTEDVGFPDIWQGKTSSTYAVLHNTGTDPLEVVNITGDGTFDGDFPTQTAQFNQNLQVPLTFSPVSAGKNTGTVTIETTAGDFTVRCVGNAISTEGMLLTEDFEDDAEGWNVYDRDGDGDIWTLAWNAYGGITEGHVHSGEECIVSFSWDYVNGSFRPDNWTFSPSFNVPETGAYLSWYVAGDDNTRLGDKYSVYVGEGDYFGDFDMNDYKCVYTDDIVSDEWTRRVVDLKEYVGKPVHIGFRHHDSEGFYMVKIDDVFVYTENPLSVESVAQGVVESTEYYTVDGLRVNRPENCGIYIYRTKYADGKVVSGKFIKK